MLTVCSTLFIHMGLCEALEKLFKVKFRVLSCTKCLTFWMNIITLALLKADILTIVFCSFSMSYIALWLELLLSILSNRYEYIYTKIYSEANQESSGKTNKVS